MIRYFCDYCGKEMLYEEIEHGVVDDGLYCIVATPTNNDKLICYLCEGKLNEELQRFFAEKRKHD